MLFRSIFVEAPSYREEAEKGVLAVSRTLPNYKKIGVIETVYEPLKKTASGKIRRDVL